VGFGGGVGHAIDGRRVYPVGIRTRLHTTRTASADIWGHGRHGDAWIAYDISLSGEVPAALTGLPEPARGIGESTAPIHSPPRKLTASMPRHNSRHAETTVTRKR